MPEISTPTKDSLRNFNTAKTKHSNDHAQTYNSPINNVKELCGVIHPSQYSFVSSLKFNRGWPLWPPYSHTEPSSCLRNSSIISFQITNLKTIIIDIINVSSFSFGSLIFVVSHLMSKPLKLWFLSASASICWSIPSKISLRFFRKKLLFIKIFIFLQS